MIIDTWEVKKEWVNFLRNSDIFSTTERNVETETQTDSLVDEDTIIIDKPNVKNIRVLKLNDIPLKYGEEYDVDFDFKDTTIKCKIVLKEDKTGDYEVVYDFGSDKIFPDFPREDLSINSFPRIGTDIISTPSDIVDFDGTLQTTINMTTVVYSDNLRKLENYITKITQAVNDNKRNFYYKGKFVRKLTTGPIIKVPEELSLDKIFQKNIDTEGILNYER